MTELTRDDVLEVCLACEVPPAAVSADTTATRRVSVTDLEEAVSATDLELPTDLLTRISAALVHSNVRLLGPPGTGKSTLAKAVLEAVVGSEGYLFTVGTAQWTGEDVIGGPVPAPENPNTLVFQPGMVLAAADAGKWLAIDEINRADIDTAFGELFGLLAGFSLELPYPVRAGSARRVVIHAERPTGQLDEGEYGLPPGWRMIATMNSWDKASLNRVSFAFSRRWCTVYVPVPEPEIFDTILNRLFAQMPQAATSEIRQALHHVFVAPGSDDQPTLRRLGYGMGAGIARSCIVDIAAMRAAGMSTADALGYALDGFVLPQLEGALEAHDDLRDALDDALELVGASVDARRGLDDRLAVFTGHHLRSAY